MCKQSIVRVIAWDLVIMALCIAIVNDLFDIYRHRPTNFQSHVTVSLFMTRLIDVYLTFVEHRVTLFTFGNFY
jgi:hypothetical protein